MSQRGAELLVVGVPGTRLAAAAERLLRRLRPGGIILLPRNIGALEETLELVAALRAAAPGALFYLDAEGGRVDRLRNLVGPAPAAAALAAQPPAAARRAGLWVGRALRAFGFDVDFAPVVDLDHGLSDNALDRRTFGRAPRPVAARAGAFLAGLHEAGVGGCVKHFPGLGAAPADTHHQGTRIELTAAALAADLQPFARLAGPAGAVMVGHASYPALTGDQRPATLAPELATRLLRAGLEFRGVAFSDDLEMGALAAWGDLGERTAAALGAGCDGLLLCQTLEVAPEVASRLAAPRLRERREQAAARLARYRRAVGRLQRRAGDPPSLAVIRRRLVSLMEATDN